MKKCCRILLNFIRGKLMRHHELCDCCGKYDCKISIIHLDVNGLTGKIGTTINYLKLCKKCKAAMRDAIEKWYNGTQSYVPDGSVDDYPSVKAYLASK